MTRNFKKTITKFKSSKGLDEGAYMLPKSALTILAFLVVFAVVLLIFWPQVSDALKKFAEGFKNYILGMLGPIGWLFGG